MKRISKMCIVSLAALFVAQPMLATAGSSARLIPAGSVRVMDNGKEVNNFKSEMPMPQGLTMAVNGKCIVQSQSLQLVAQDQAVFALNEAESRYDLTIKSGRVDFAMRPEAKPVSFHTPHDLIQSEQAIVPAGNAGLVRGFVTVSEEKTELSIQEGALQVMSSDGTQLVQPGHSIVLAQARLGSTTPATGGKGTVKPALTAGSSGGALTTKGMVMGGAGVLSIIGAGVGFATSNNNASENGLAHRWRHGQSPFVSPN